MFPLYHSVLQYQNSLLDKDLKLEKISVQTKRSLVYSNCSGNCLLYPIAYLFTVCLKINIPLTDFLTFLESVKTEAVSLESKIINFLFKHIVHVANCVDLFQR